MLESINSGKFTYKKLTEEEQQSRGILGRLYGVIADTKSPTRNGRKYDKNLWEQVFENDIMKEKIENHLILGELGHPENRTEVDISKAAICLAEKPKLGDDGKLYGVFDIISTPNGRILKSLCDYGCVIGVSSRGTGDLYTDDDGNESVDPSTYCCECWDAVLIPAVKEARMSYVTESLERNKTLKQVLHEELEKASDEDRKVMEDTLDDMGLSEAIDDSRFKGWDPEDINLWKNTDWESRDYQDLPVLDDSFESEANAYGDIDSDGKENVKFIKYIRPNPIFPPYYAPEEKPFGDLSVLGPMYDGNKHNMYDIHDRYETQELYDKLSECRNSVKLNRDNKQSDLTEDIDPRSYTNVIKAINLGIEDDGDIEGIKNYLHDIINYCYSVAEDFDIPVKDIIGESLTNEPTNGRSDKSSNEVVDNKSKEEPELVAEFQEALSRAKSLEEDNLSLKEKLSVCNAKEMALNEQLAKYKKATVVLSESAKKSKTLKDKLNYKDELLESSNQTIRGLKKDLSENLKSDKANQAVIKQLEENALKLESKLNSLSENYSEISKQLENSKQLVEKYKKSYNGLKNRYLEVKATNYGLSKEEILGKLDESYKIKDIDSVCEELNNYKRKINKLPFALNENTKISITGSKEYIGGTKSANNNTTGDDYVSESLLRFADLK